MVRLFAGRWRSWACLVVITVFGLPVAASADALVVVETKRVIGYRAGDIVEVGQTLSLAADAELTLLTANGEKIQVAGPLDGPLAQRLRETMPELLAPLDGSQRQLLESLADILRQHRRSAMLLRNIPKPPEPKDAWQISIISNDDQCYLDGQLPELWRPKGGGGDVVVIKSEQLKDETFVNFDAEAETHPWPLDLDLDPGESYQVVEKGAGKEHRLVLHLIPGDLPTRAHVAAALNEKNCRRQAAQLLLMSDIDKFIGRMITDDKF